MTLQAGAIYHETGGLKRIVKCREQFKGVKVEKKLILSHDLKAGIDKKPLSLIGFLSLDHKPESSIQ